MTPTLCRSPPLPAGCRLQPEAQLLEGDRPNQVAMAPCQTRPFQHRRERHYIAYGTVLINWVDSPDGNPVPISLAVNGIYYFPSACLRKPAGSIAARIGSSASAHVGTVLESYGGQTCTIFGNGNTNGQVQFCPAGPAPGLPKADSATINPRPSLASAWPPSPPNNDYVVVRVWAVAWDHHCHGLQRHVRPSLVQRPPAFTYGVGTQPDRHPGFSRWPRPSLPAVPQPPPRQIPVDSTRNRSPVLSSVSIAYLTHVTNERARR